MFFFQGFLPTLSSLHRQSQRYMFVLSKPKDTNTTTKRLHNQAVFQITWTAWNLRNVNIYWRWSCHTSYGCFIKLPRWPLASIVTGKANCAAKVRPIFIIVITLCEHLCSRVFGVCHVCELDIVLFVR